MTNTMWIICLQVLLNGFFFEMSEAQTSLSYFAEDTVELSCPLSGTFTFPVWRGPPSSTKYTLQDDDTGTINSAALAYGRLKYDSDNKTLLLSRAVTDDSGSYSCSYGGIGSHTITLTVSEKTTTTSTYTNSTTTSTTTPTTTTTTTPSTTPSASSLSDEMIAVIVIVPVGVIALVGTVIFFYRRQMGKRKPASDKRHKRGKHYKGNMRPVQQHQQQPYILYGRHHTGESTIKDSKRSRSLHNDDRYNWYDGSQVKQNPMYKGDRNLDRLYYNETLPRNDDYWSGYTTGHVYPSHTSGYHYKPDYDGDSRGQGNRQYSSYPVYSRQQENINPSYSYMGY